MRQTDIPHMVSDALAIRDMIKDRHPPGSACNECRELITDMLDTLDDHGALRAYYETLTRLDYPP